jgi:hypothetical protein
MAVALIIFALACAKSFSRENQDFLPFSSPKKCSFLQLFEAFYFAFLCLGAIVHPRVGIIPGEPFTVHMNTFLKSGSRLCEAHQWAGFVTPPWEPERLGPSGS